MLTAAPLSLSEARAALLRRDFSCVEYACDLIERQARWRHINGFAHFNEEHLLAQAARSDRELKRSADPRRLLGLPIAIKDNINTAFMPTGGGTAAFERVLPPQNAPVLVQLLKAGAVVAGKANMHELAFGVSNNNRVTGTVRNPFDLARIPGGSSGGSGALVGAGVVPAALGTDTGGSVRIPAALCGAVGLRPTQGRYLPGGVIPISTTRDTVGPIARSVDDIALLDAILAGDTLQAVERQSDRPIRLAVPRSTLWQGLEPEVERVMDVALEKLKRAGVELVDIDLNAYPGFFDKEHALIAKYEFRFAMQEYIDANGHALTLEEIVSEIGSPDVAEIARYITLPGAISEFSYLDALKKRDISRAAYSQCLHDTSADALVFPTTVATACLIPAVDSMIHNGQNVGVFATFTRNTEPGSNAGVPGITLPAGIASNGLPVGLALDAAAGMDRELIAITRDIETALGQISRPQ
ncbi:MULTISPECIES: indoleacetamide hydrolase [unclassified Paraburkholderia]|uniref:indoleacetamide hydrolase n=1 Tax=unclassified Paraburkholderia TaxID=2615204 RepID=UPI002AAF8199|nr:MULTISPECIES: indoleacetamide hydrolase [unclassified Paraburkholderia]